MKHQEKLRIYRTLLEAGESLRVARSPKSAGPLRHDEIERASVPRSRKLLRRLAERRLRGEA